MLAECIPEGFEWKNPSKIQFGEVFHLLDHWRDHKDQGLESLAWVPTSPLFRNTNPSLKEVWPFCHAKALDPHDSDEEVFVLPSSDGIDEEKDAGMVPKPSENVAAVGQSSGDGSPTDLEHLAMQSSDQVDSPYGESNISCPRVLVIMCVSDCANI